MSPPQTITWVETFGIFPVQEIEKILWLFDESACVPMILRKVSVESPNQEGFAETLGPLKRLQQKRFRLHQEEFIQCTSNVPLTFIILQTAMEICKNFVRILFET
jgi:hypothetical protein